MATETTVILDGVTVQHAGELLFDTQSTVHLRKPCRATYLRSLEDVVFALVLGGRVAVSKNLPMVGPNEWPGRDLCAFYSEHITPIPDEQFEAPGLVLANADAVSAIGELLKCFQDVERSDYAVWTEFITREAAAYFWPSDAQFRSALAQSAPRVAVFGKNYWRSEVLEASVTGPLADHLTSAVWQQVGPAVTADHARAFVEQVISAHLLIYEWYQRSIDGVAIPGELPIRMPHVTRATVLATDRFLRNLTSIRELIVPALLIDALQGKPSRNQVRERIGDLIDDQRLEPLRSILQRAMTEGDEGKLEGIKRDLSRASSGWMPASDASFVLKAGFLGPLPRVELEGRLRLSRSTPLADSLAFAVRPAHDRAEELVQFAARVFPELE